MTTLADDLVSGELWALVEPLLPAPTAPALWRPAPHHLRPGLLGRDRVHGPHLDSVAAAARPRTGLWLARDLLAAADRVGQRRRPSSTSCTCRSWIASACRTGWSGTGRASTP
jgi:hypothetical protein